MGFEQEMAETKTAVAQLASWCLTVALHQEFGIGAGRLERLAKVLRRIQEENVAAVLSQGTEAAARQRKSWIQGKAQLDFPVPLLRAPRTRREKQLRMAGDEAAAIAWQIYAAGVIQEFEFGADRLERLRQAGRDNYRQFNEWAKEDGLEVAMERLCAGASMPPSGRRCGWWTNGPPITGRMPPPWSRICGPPRRWPTGSGRPGHWRCRASSTPTPSRARYSPAALLKPPTAGGTDRRGPWTTIPPGWTGCWCWLQRRP